MSRLTEAFGGRWGGERRKHDYVDTQAYAGEFLRVVEWLVAHPAPPSAEATAATETPIGNDHTSMLPTGAIAPVIVLRVEFRRKIWVVARDGHYHERLSALDAAVAAATAIVAQSGRADVALEYELSAADRSAHERGVNVPRSGADGAIQAAAGGDYDGHQLIRRTHRAQ
jgi:hypothetical protein